jgi:hypothetical protein
MDSVEKQEKGKHGNASLEVCNSAFFVCKKGRYGLLEDVHEHTHSCGDAYN